MARLINDWNQFEYSLSGNRLQLHLLRNLFLVGFHYQLQNLLKIEDWTILQLLSKHLEHLKYLRSQKLYLVLLPDARNFFCK